MSPLTLAETIDGDFPEFAEEQLPALWEQVKAEGHARHGGLAHDRATNQVSCQCGTTILPAAGRYHPGQCHQAVA